MKALRVLRLPVAAFLILSLASSAFAAKNNRCGTRVLSVEEEAVIESALANNGRHASGVVIPVYVHVISSGAGFANGEVSDRAIREQINVLNSTFAGERGGSETGFSFDLVATDRTTNADWFFMGYNSQAENRAKASLRRGGSNALNLYTVDGGAYLGWATFPNSYKSQSESDGVVLDFRSLPGGPYAAYSLGFTATHETGHWLGLYHTFQNGCSTNNDYVGDTAAERYPARGCPVGIDTCTSAKYPGIDPVFNYMDYSDDACYSEFTEGQTTRMQAAFATYRQ
jgi:hypothetical protein